MTGTAHGGLTLVIREVAGRKRRLLDPSALRDFVSRVLVVHAGERSGLYRAVERAFSGIDVRDVVLADGASAEDRTRAFHDALGPDDRWLLLVDDGCNALPGPSFELPDTMAPRHVLHYSRRDGVGCWAAVLAPADRRLIGVDPGGRIVARTDQRVTMDPGVLAIELAGVGSAAAAAHRHAVDNLPDPCLDTDRHGYFAIARSHERAGRHAQAQFWYHRQLADETADEETRWTARYRAARCLIRGGAPRTQVEAALLEAFDTDPGRAEPLYHLACLRRDAGQIDKAYELASLALDIPMPVTGHAFEWSIYNHQLCLLFMACAAALHRDVPCIEAGNTLLRRAPVPEQARVEAARIRSACLDRLAPVPRRTTPYRNRIVVIVPFRNAGGFLKSCTDSLASQDYPHCRFVLIDDASTDGALDGLILDDPRFIVLRNTERRGGLCNQVDTLDRYCAPDDIAVYLDGDDRLLDSDVLGYINEFFNATGCWLMYGQYRESGGRYGRCEPIVGNRAHVLDAFREIHFPMHIRAHRAGLFQRLRERDPNLCCLRDEDGGFLEAINDMTLMRALMQLAGLARIRYNDRIVYEYNTRNPGSHFREHKRLQDRQCRVLNAKPALAPVASYLGS